MRFDGDDTRLDGISIPMTSVVPMMLPNRWTHVEFPLRRLKSQLNNPITMPSLNRISFIEIRMFCLKCDAMRHIVV